MILLAALHRSWFELLVIAKFTCVLSVAIYFLGS
jgi:hypothetical protein